MTHRLSWLLSFLCALAFVVLYQKWMAWLVMGAVLLLPLFSLVISLPAMLTARLTMQLPRKTHRGFEIACAFRCKQWLPTPAWRCRIKVTNALTGETMTLRPGDLLPTYHCGELHCQLKRVRICDYLGIFSIPLRAQRSYRMLVEPEPVALPREQCPSLEKIGTWKPKAGGFAENHELRLYRPGDSVRQIHWKMSAKTGKLILREPMVPNPGRVLVRLELKGTGEQLDRMLGRVIWLGQRLLEEGLPFELHCLTGDGLMNINVGNELQRRRSMDRLLRCSPAEEGSLFERPETASQIYDIGGEPDEE